MKIGITELILLLIIVLLIFGPRQLPKLGRIFGKSIGKAKKAIDELEEE